MTNKLMEKYEMSGTGVLSTYARKVRERAGRRAEMPDEIAKKLKSCSVMNCEDWRDLASYTTYHCFPTGEKNQDRWEIWTQLLRKAREDDEWIPFRGSLVCSHHFRPEDFVNDPYSKRRKLLKNAIPSIFPTFTVDLDDPSYQLPDDEQGVDVDEESGLIYTEVDPACFLDEGQIIQESFYEDPSSSNDVYDDEVQVIEHNVAPKPSFSSIKIVASAPATTNFAKNRNVKSNFGINNGPSTSTGQMQVIMPPQQIMSVRQEKRVPTILSNRQLIVPQSCKAATAFGNASTTILPKRKERKTKEEPAIMKTIQSLPFSLNPDLEIEVVDPAGAEDLAACRQRVSELEQENRSLITMYENEIETLKQNYEFEIQKLQRQIRQQEKLLTMNMISPSKKARLS